MDKELAKRLVEMDHAHVWHPFTAMRPWLAESDPARIIEAAEGFELIDAGGRRYIDGFSSLWCNLHGHRVPEIDRAIREQLDKVAHTTLLGFSSPPSIELAEKLVRLAPPGLTKVFYSDCGASAVEVALKMAFQYWHIRGQTSRRKFIALRDSYHGDTIGSVGVGGIDIFHRLFKPLLFETTFADCPNPYHHPRGDGAAQAVLEQIDGFLAAAPDEYCAVIVEPLIQAAAGMLTHDGRFLRELRDLTRRRNVLLIADEVATGFCRTGAMFACGRENISPDLLCVGKGLTGGYLPVSATLASQEIFDAFLGGGEDKGYGGKTFFHGHTFSGNALGCVAAIASLDRIESTRLLEALPEKIELMRRSLSALAGHPNVGDIRQCGMMAGVELVQRRARDFFAPEQRVGGQVCRLAQEHGVILRPLGDVVVLMPAPGMDMATLKHLMEATVAAITGYFSGKRAHGQPVQSS